ncbi:MAG: ATP-binding protein [Pseudomonadota bacterium]|nr:ATP-binding protein [Pseudomonadota bacterium]
MTASKPVIEGLTAETDPYRAIGLIVPAVVAMIGIMTLVLSWFLFTVLEHFVPALIIGALGMATLAATGFLISRWFRMEALHSLVSDMLEDSIAGRVIVAPSDRIVFISGAFRRFGFDARMRKFFDLMAPFRAEPDSWDTIRRLAMDARDGATHMVEISARMDGKLRWFKVEARPLVGRPHIHWRFEDITSARQREIKADTDKRRLYDFMDNAPVGFCAFDANGKFIFVNRTLVHWLNSSFESLLDGDIHLHDILVTPPSQGAPTDIFEIGGSSQQGETLLRSTDGHVFSVLITQTLLTDEQGRPMRTRTVVRDLTSEREWQAALQYSEHRVQRYFEDAPIGIAWLGRDGILAECNTAMAKLLGLELSRIVRKPLVRFVADADRSGFVAELDAAFAGQRSRPPFEIRLTGKRSFPAQVHTRHLDMGPDGSHGLILHVIDMSEQKNLEAQFAQSQKMQAIGQLAGGVAHDFNNLLTAMIGFCDLLFLRHRAGDPSFADIMQIKQNANRAANLVRQLLAFSRQQTLQPKILDVTDVLTELSHLLRRLIGADVALTIHHGRDLGLIKSDQGQLEQVLINLAVNARDAVAGGGRIDIRTANSHNDEPVSHRDEIMPPGDWVVITVEDTGCGIDPKVLPRIFDPFFSTKATGAGTGLGLSTVYGIIHQTGGFITVDSEKGAGTRFAIYLPHHNETDEATVVTPPPEPNEDMALDLTGRGKILLVEDEDPVRMFSARALRNKGYEVIEANSGPAALEILKKEHPAPVLVITDVVMPEMDGPSLVDAARDLAPEAKVIFISGYTEDRLKSRFENRTDTVFLAKPFTLKQLAAKVKLLLDG